MVASPPLPDDPPQARQGDAQMRPRRPIGHVDRDIHLDHQVIGLAHGGTVVACAVFDHAARQAVAADHFDKGPRRGPLLGRFIAEPANRSIRVEQHLPVELGLGARVVPFADPSGSDVRAIGKQAGVRRLLPLRGPGRCTPAQRRRGSKQSMSIEPWQPHEPVEGMRGAGERADARGRPARSKSGGRPSRRASGRISLRPKVWVPKD